MFGHFSADNSHNEINSLWFLRGGMDEDKFTEVYEANKQKLLRYFRCRRIDEHTVEDLVQDTMVSVFLGYDRLRRKERVGEWVFAIARAKVYGWFRWKYRQIAEEEIRGDEFAVESTEQGDEKQVVNEVLQVLEELPEKWRRSVQGYYLKGKSLQVIAEDQGITKNCAKQWLYRGRMRLREKLLMES